MIAVYCRVSTDEQARNETIQTQLDFARKYCELHGFTDIQYFCDEGISGVIPLGERPAGSRLIEATKNGLSQVLFYRLDRLGRSARIILNAVHELEQYGVRVRSMTEPFDTQDPTGRFLLTILAGVADLERETIIERTYAGMRRAVAKGKWPGTPPFGYLKDENGLLIPDERPIPGLEHLTAAGVVELIYNLVARQNYTTVQVADYLNALGVPPAGEIQREFLKRRQKNKKGWLPAFVWHILNDETYIGKRIFRANKTHEQIITEVPPLISQEIKEKTKQVLTEHSRKHWYKPKHKYLLTGMVRCGICGLIYTGRAVKRYRYGTGEKYIERSYVCNSKRSYGNKACGNQNVNADKLETAVWDKIVTFINNPGPILQEIAEQIKNQNPSILFEEEKKLTMTLAEKENEKQRVMSLFRKGIISMADVEDQLGRIEDERKILSQRLTEVKSQVEEIQFIEQRAKEALELILLLGEEIKQPLTFERKRQIVKTFIKEIIVHPGKPRKPKIKIEAYFDVQGINELGDTSKTPTIPCHNLLTPSIVTNGPF
jgi:site-specific DNA recombinase